MRDRLTICVKLLSVTSLSVLLSGCSVAEYRQQYFANFQPTTALRKVDAAVVIEATASGFPDNNSGEAFRQVMIEDLTTLFAKTPLVERRPDVEFVLLANVQFQGMFPPSTVTATVAVVDLKTGATMGSYTRSAGDSTFIGDIRMRRLGEQFVGQVLAGLKGDLVKTLDQIMATRQVPFQPLPGLQGDR